MHTIRPGQPEDLAAIVNLWNIVWPHHFRGLEEVRREVEMPSVECRPQFLLVERDGEVVGCAEFNRDLGSYHPLKWSVAISVRPESRKQGIGRSLHDAMLTGLSELGAISLTTRVSDDDAESINFVMKRSYREIKRDFEAELQIAAVPSSLLDSSVTSPVTIKPIIDVDSPDFRREFHETFEEIRVDTPRTDPPTPIEFEHFVEFTLDEPDFLPQASQVAFVDGRIAGFTGLYKMEQEGGLFQWLTGVRREHRGKKIAKALKVEALKWAAANGFKTIRTDNDTRNAPMLAINDQLGFRRLPGMITYRLEHGAEARE